MAICPFAVWEPLPENANAPVIDPDMFIMHSAVSKATDLRGYFAREDVVVESTFYINEQGTLFQFMDTCRMADANYGANGRAVSVETWDNGDPDHIPWNEAQVATLIRLGQWLVAAHPKIAVRRAPAYNQSGIGGHSDFPQWSNVRGKTCPGLARRPQVDGIIAAIAGTPGTPVTPTPVPTPPATAGVGFRGDQVLPGWNLPAGYYLGDMKGPKQEVGGFYGPEAHVKAVQQLWIAAGLVPGVPASQWRTSGWADGKWDARFSDPICRAWFARYRNNQPIHNQVWSDDYALMRKQVF